MKSPSLAFIAALALAGLARAQQILVPLGQAMTDTGSSTATWRNTLFRFQMMYDNSTFTSPFSSVIAPIVINRLRFRCADGTLNPGGQVFSNVTVRLYDSPTTLTTVLSASTVAASTATSISASGLIASQFASGASDAQRCFRLTFTSGANSGLTRFVSANTATTITVSVAFPAAPAIGDTYTVDRLPINYNNMAQNFAANIGANVGVPEIFPTVSVTPAIGCDPNSYVIDLNLGSSIFVYDPTTMGNLVIEVDAPTAPAPTTNFPSFATSSVAATSKARRNSTGTAGASFGALSEFASICLIDFLGAGGNNTIAASATSYGTACGQSPNLNEYFGGNGLTAQQQPFDLANKSLLFTPDNITAPVNYTLTSGTTPPDLTQTIGTANISDDDVVTITPAWAAPFAFPGGSCTQLAACMNGFVWLGTGLTDFSPSVAEWLGGTTSNFGARIAPLWKDMHGGRNTTLFPLAGLYTSSIGFPGSQVTYITWREIGEFNNSIPGASVSTYQVVLTEATGQIEIRYGATAPLCSGGITGFTRGTMGAGVNCTDSGSADLSGETVGGLTGNGPNGLVQSLILTTSARPIIGTATNMTVTGIAPTDTIGLWLWDIPPGAPTIPGVPIPLVTDVGCRFSLSAAPSWFLDWIFTPPASLTSTSVGWPLPAAGASYPVWPNFPGFHVYVQYTSAPGALVNHRLSNALDLKLGYQ